MKTPEPFPWRQVMAFGFGVLRLSPGQFWSMTIREWQAAIESNAGASTDRVSRDWLTNTMHQFPDGADKETINAGN